MRVLLTFTGTLDWSILGYYYIWGDSMEWIVCDVIYFAKNDIYFLKLYSRPLKMIAEVVSTEPIFRSDILYPIKDAKYLVNKNENRPVKVIRASEYSASYWLSQKKIYRNQSRKESVQTIT
ncbi:polymyxin B resistance protein pmrD [Klebsiella quasipneumoniae subsp. similipneumoniae]|uniref:polymyxin B resistance protein pmrD n=2 Tax=Klebsiella quasipneumoniae TaxID=1463165 RepID=UPI002B053D11|nr:polymyxin B resistance protein pmrD [Klebsiella quasipneumoniae]